MSSTGYYCRPADNLATTASVSLTAGTAAAAFPLANVKDLLAHSVFKATGTSCTIRFTWGSPVTPEAISIHFHNLAGATVTISNGAGFSNGLPIPANTADGHCLDPWEDYRGLANRNSTTWDVAITGASANVAIGEIVIWGTVREAELDRGAVSEEDQVSIVHEGDYHPRIHCYRLGTRVRAFSDHITPLTTASDLLTLSRGAKGPLLPFALVPDSTVNDALFGYLLNSRHRFVENAPRGSGSRETDLSFLEALRGLAL